jgi:hypothetical protein
MSNVGGKVELGSGSGVIYDPFRDRLEVWIGGQWKEVDRWCVLIRPDPRFSETTCNQPICPMLIIQELRGFISYVGNSGVKFDTTRYVCYWYDRTDRKVRSFRSEDNPPDKNWIDTIENCCGIRPWDYWHHPNFSSRQLVREVPTSEHTPIVAFQAKPTYDVQMTNRVQQTEIHNATAEPPTQPREAEKPAVAKPTPEREAEKREAEKREAEKREAEKREEAENRRREARVSTVHGAEVARAHNEIRNSARDIFGWERAWKDLGFKVDWLYCEPTFDDKARYFVYTGSDDARKNSLNFAAVSKGGEYYVVPTSSFDKRSFSNDATKYWFDCSAVIDYAVAVACVAKFDERNRCVPAGRGTLIERS